MLHPLFVTIALHLLREPPTESEICEFGVHDPGVRLSQFLVLGVENVMLTSLGEGRDAIRKHFFEVQRDGTGGGLQHFQGLMRGE